MRNVQVAACVASSVAIAGAPLAQPAPAQTAASVLSNVQTYYANANQLTAQFRQIVTNATVNTTKTSDGMLWVAKPSQFRWDYVQKKNGVVTIAKTFILDGQTFWLVDHDNKQVVQSQVQNNALPAAVSFLIGGNLSAQFNAVLNPTGSYAAKGSIVLELTPKQASAQYSKLFFVVDPSNWRVTKSIIIDANGDTNTFKFYAPSLTAPIKAQWFQVNLSTLPGYSVVRARGSASPLGSGSASSHP